MKLLCKRLFSPTVILSLLLLLAGITALILTNYPTGIRFLLQLTALGWGEKITGLPAFKQINVL